jgi:hypothetical protein
MAGISVEKLLLDLFKVVAQYILGPMAVAWLTGKLNKKSKTRN